MFRYEGCYWPFPHRLTGDGYTRFMGLEPGQCGWLRIWTEEDDAFIRAQFPCSIESLKRHFECSSDAVVRKLCELGLRIKKPGTGKILRWQAAQDAELKKLHGHLPVPEIAKRMGFSESYVQHRATLLNLHADWWVMKKIAREMRETLHAQG
jgi:hypothetical protein